MASHDGMSQLSLSSLSFCMPFQAACELLRLTFPCEDPRGISMLAILNIAHVIKSQIWAGHCLPSK